MFAVTLTNPPNPDDPDFNIAVSRVATHMNIHLNSNNVNFLKFGKGLLKGSYPIDLMTISQSHDNYQVKCGKVLDIWARKSGSKWEDVIEQLKAIELTGLAEELTKTLASSSQPPAHTPGTVNSSSTPGILPIRLRVISLAFPDPCIRLCIPLHMLIKGLMAMCT